VIEACVATNIGMIFKWKHRTLLQPLQQFSLIIVITVQHLQLSGKGLLPLAPSGKLFVGLMDLHFKSSYACGHV